ncbi:hypothetical protein [Sporosarcina newyorkensis]|uniref:hypothetical protein n=1 Tax=Sporosarcina newyorkensis TaxID=759851 RepID=UPI003D01AC12
MTIISAVFVPEGIVMSADSRLTGHMQQENGIDRFSLSDNAQKLVLVRDSNVGVSFCGDAIIDGKTVADFLRVFDIEQVDKFDTVQKVAEKLSKYLAKNCQQYSVAFIVAGFDDDEQFIYSLDKEVCLRRNIEDNGELFRGAFWNGEIEPVSKLFHETPFNFNLMPLKDAIDFAEFIAEIAIKYERFVDKIPTCGGPIDILVITKDFTKFFKHKILNP